MSVVLRYAILAVLLLSSACSANVIDVTYDPCSPLLIVPAEGTQPAELESIEAAVQAWSAVLPTHIELAEPGAEVEGLRVSFDSGDTFYRAMYWDNLGEITISREKLAAADQPMALAHELGHAFGLFHVEKGERLSVMNLHNLDIAPNQEDARAVGELWQACGTAP